MKWIDTTSYSQGDTKREPRVFSANLGPYLRVVVVKGHIHYPGQWVMSLHPLFSDKPLDLPDVAKPDVAQERAQWLVGEIVHEIERHLR